MWKKFGFGEGRRGQKEHENPHQKELDEKMVIKGGEEVPKAPVKEGGEEWSQGLEEKMIVRITQPEDMKKAAEPENEEPMPEMDWAEGLDEKMVMRITPPEDMKKGTEE